LRSIAGSPARLPVLLLVIVGVVSLDCVLIQSHLKS
jgi:hypothetical protein